MQALPHYLTPAATEAIKRACAHTPGPWAWKGSRLAPVNPDFDHSDVHSILDAEGGYGFLGSSVAATSAELDADRALIAAAPDLLAALLAMEHEFGRTYLQGSSPAVDAARAAISKATGSAP